jgi:hypothetical protein
MKKTLIIVSGMPATGKTRFADWLSVEMGIPLLSLDEVWEKIETSAIPFAQYWALCENMTKSSSTFIIEFGFSNEIKPEINGLAKKYDYQTINIHFDTSFEIAHRRFNDRRLYDSIQFSHSFNDQIGGQLSAGFVITAAYEDTDSTLYDGNAPDLINKSLKDAGISTYWATRAVKYTLP